MASAERKRCSNMAPDFRFRSLAWMNARRLPGVRCSTLKTRCSCSLCLMIMPGRICVAGIAIERKLLAGRALRRRKIGLGPPLIVAYGVLGRDGAGPRFNGLGPFTALAVSGILTQMLQTPTARDDHYSIAISVAATANCRAPVPG